MKVIKPKDNWKYVSPRVTQVFFNCDKCQGKELSITGFKQHSATEHTFRITCKCGHSEIGVIETQQVIAFLIFPEIKTLLSAFLPKPRVKKEEAQSNLW